MPHQQTLLLEFLSRMLSILLLLDLIQELKPMLIFSAKINKIYPVAPMNPEVTMSQQMEHKILWL
jgi:hypothetical protein